MLGLRFKRFGGCKNAPNHYTLRLEGKDIHVNSNMEPEIDTDMHLDVSADIDIDMNINTDVDIQRSFVSNKTL